jgi:acyl carrier protein
MTESDRASIVRQIVREHARIDAGDPHDGQVLTRDLGFDSLAFLLTVSDLEGRLGFRFPLEQVDRLREISVADLVSLVAGAAAAPPATGGTALGA